MHHMDGFEKAGNCTLNDTYIDGISFTHGSLRRHLWNYAVGESQQPGAIEPCPCSMNRTAIRVKVPNYVGNHFYSIVRASGFVSRFEKCNVWEDPLWDRSGCFRVGNQCCARYGWFNRHVTTSSDPIDVR